MHSRTHSLKMMPFALVVALIGCGNGLRDRPGISPGGAAQLSILFGSVVSTDHHDFTVLAGFTIPNAGPGGVTGDVGLNPGNATTGFFTIDGAPETLSGPMVQGDPVDALAPSHFSIAFTDAAGRPSRVSVSTSPGETTLTTDISRSMPFSESSSGDLTLDDLSETDAVFVFQVASALRMTSGHRIMLAGGTQASTVFWHPGASDDLRNGS